MDLQHHDNELINLLLKRQAELNSLLELTQAINKGASLKELLEMLHVILKVHLNVHQFRFFLKQEGLFKDFSGFGDAYVAPQKRFRKSALRKHIYEIKQQQLPSKDLFWHYDFYVPIISHRKLCAFVLVKSMDEGTGFLNHDLQFIQTLVGQVVFAEENKQLLRDKLEKERLERELELGRQVQYMLIPEQLLTDSSVEINAWYQPHESVGGDYFDFAKINGTELMWCIADVSGKGIAAALLMANLQASLRAWVANTRNPMEIIERLNEFIWKNTRGEWYITLFLGIYDTETRLLSYVNAGHHPPILFHDHQYQALKSGTIMLGAFEKLPFIDVGLQYLQSGDFIFNYTDGLIERKNVAEHFCEQQLADFLRLNLHLPIYELHQSLLKYIEDSIQIKAPTDDLTMLSVRIN